MYEAFERLREEKRDIILSAALDEFAAAGYQRASTNGIVAAAGISKGALFHYFGDKKSLFLYLCGHAVRILETEYFTPLCGASNDLIERLQTAVGLKMKLLARYPRLFAFCAGLLKETCAEVEPEMKRFREKMVHTQQNVLFDGLDDTLLKQGIPPREGFRMLRWILEDYSNELAERYGGKIPEEEEMKRAVLEFEEFVRLLRGIFYRQEDGDYESH